MIRKALLPLAAMIVTAVLASGAAASDYVSAIRTLVEEDMRGWIQSDEIVTAIKEQNKTSATLSQSEIDARDLQCRAETEGVAQPQINSVHVNRLPAYLKDIPVKSDWLYTAMF